MRGSRLPRRHPLHVLAHAGGMNRRVSCVHERPEFSLAVQHSAPVHQRHPGEHVVGFRLEAAGDLRVHVGERAGPIDRDRSSKPGLRLADELMEGWRLAGHEELVRQRAIVYGRPRRVRGGVGPGREIYPFVAVVPKVGLALPQVERPEEPEQHALVQRCPCDRATQPAGGPTSNIVFSDPRCSVSVFLSILLGSATRYTYGGRLPPVRRQGREKPSSHLIAALSLQKPSFPRLSLYERPLSRLLLASLLRMPADPDQKHDQRDLRHLRREAQWLHREPREPDGRREPPEAREDRKSTRLNSSHTVISYAVFCLKKKKKKEEEKKIKKKKEKRKREE